MRVRTQPALSGPSPPRRAAARASQGSRAGAGTGRRRGGARARGRSPPGGRTPCCRHPVRSAPALYAAARCSAGYCSRRGALSVGSLREGLHGNAERRREGRGVGGESHNIGVWRSLAWKKGGRGKAVKENPRGKFGLSWKRNRSPPCGCEQP